MQNRKIVSILIIFILLTTFLPTSIARLQITKVSNHGVASNSLFSNVVKKWTVLIYLDGDNELEGMAIKKINFLEEYGSDENINVIVQFDGYQLSKETVIYYIVKDNDYRNISSPIVKSLKEQNMGSPHTLIDFVCWSINCYPADHYLLALWDHGNGWRGGICYDYTNDDHLSMYDLKVAMNGIKNTISKKIDIILFDACLMGMLETYYQIKDTANICIGSEELVPGYGCPYELVLSDLKRNPTYDALSLSKKIVEKFSNYYTGIAHTISSFWLDKISKEVVSKLDKFAKLLSERINDYKKEIKKSAETTHSYTLDYYKDLYDFAYQINTNIDNMDIQKASYELMNEIRNATIAEKHYHAGKSHGLSIYLPNEKADYDSSYCSLDLSFSTHWDEFIKSYIKLNKFIFDAKSLIEDHVIFRKLWGFLL
jgi:hypothetical protein